MNKSIIIFTILFFLISCAIDGQVIDPDRIVTQKEEKLALGEITQTLNVKYQELFPLIQQVFSVRNIPIKKIDSGLGKLVSVPIPVTERKASIPLNCDVTIKIQAEAYQLIASRIKVSYLEQCDGLEAHDLKQADSNAEKLVLSLVHDIKAASR